MVERFRDLQVYRDAFRAAQQIYDRSSEWPKAERYALTDQIRRSSRSVNANIAEAWRKRLYPKAFVNKLSNADAEAAETRSWLDFALAHEYLSKAIYNELDDQYDKVQGSLVNMMNDPHRWCSPADSVQEDHSSYFASGPLLE